MTHLYLKMDSRTNQKNFCLQSITYANSSWIWPSAPLKDLVNIQELIDLNETSKKG